MTNTITVNNEYFLLWQLAHSSNLNDFKVHVQNNTFIKTIDLAVGNFCCIYNSFYTVLCTNITDYGQLNLMTSLRLET